MKEEELILREANRGSGRSPSPCDRTHQTLLDAFLSIREERDLLRQRLSDLELLLIDSLENGGGR